jgi:hypothetical protein
MMGIWMMCALMLTVMGKEEMTGTRLPLRLKLSPRYRAIILGMLGLREQGDIPCCDVLRQESVAFRSPTIFSFPVPVTLLYVFPFLLVFWWAMYALEAWTLHRPVA